MVAFIVGLLGVFLFSGVAKGGDIPAVMLSTPVGISQASDPEPFPTADAACRLCHSDTAREIEFQSGQTMSVHVELAVLDNSVHGKMATDPLTCTACHRPADDYKQPHAPVEAADLETYQTAKSAQCESCHFAVHPTAHPGPESATSVICTDCHGSHDVTTIEQLQTTEGMGVCISCHEQANVRTRDPDILLNLIQNGFFTNDAPDNAYCLSCHSQPDFTLTFDNGDTKSLTIDPEAFDGSVHGEGNQWQPLQCTNCHEGATYPHEPIRATSAREYSLERYPVCRECHDHNYEKALDSVHGAAIAAGKEEAAVCTDCHHTHDTPPPDEPRERISHTCEQCHSTIFNEYASSVHGDALLTESNPDVPTCIECHGVHNINDPTTALARVRSPLLCAGCHANAELMDQYGISTDVFNTYVADFHGTTVTLFEHQDPNVETNKAVCYDCHGVHSIRAPDDPEAGIKANLLVTCQQCHPDATDDFSDAWTSHFRPSLEHNTLVYLVNLFYQIVIPATVGFFGLLVSTDIYRRIRMRLSKASGR
jgi:predicted CXXCH cytochrome family protein